MGWMDDLLGKTIQQNAAPLPDRKLLNFVGFGFTVADNPQNESTDITIGDSGGGKDPLSPQSNGGVTPAYPTNAIYAVSLGATFVRSAVADYDSIRIFGAGGGELNQVAFLQGVVVNVTSYAIAFYPLPTQHLWIGGADYGAGSPFTVAPGSSARWVLDAALHLYILT